MRNSSLTHLLYPDFLFSKVSLSLIYQLIPFPVLLFAKASDTDNSEPVLSATLGNLASGSLTKKQGILSRRAPILLAFLAIFCFGMGLGIQQIFPNTKLSEDQMMIVETENSRLGACKITEEQVSMDLTLISSPRIKIQIKQFGGEIVYRRDVNLGRQKKLNMDIDLSVLPDGIYMLKVESGDQQMVRLITRS